MVLFGILSIIAKSASAQAPGNQKDKTPYPSDKIGKIAKEARANGWVFFKDDLTDKPNEVITKHKEAFGLDLADELLMTETYSVEGGLTRLRYTQKHAGVPVEGSDFSIYARGAKADHATGTLGHKITDAAIPALREEKALSSALKVLDAKRYV